MNRIIHLLLVCAVIFFGITPPFVFAQTKIDDFIVNGSYLAKDGNELIGYNAYQSFVPASTIKILTSLLALETLGPDYRFKTHFYLDRGNNLYIKGFGDPFLTSEVILIIAKELAKRGLTKIQTLYLDDTAFCLDDGSDAPGSTANPYDAPNGSLAVNFNALPLEVAQDGTISSGEIQTPTLSLMELAGKNLKAGKYRININTVRKKSILSPALCYTGELFAAQFGHAGIFVKGGFQRKKVSKNAQLIYLHKSTMPLSEIIRACLKYSNNFIANQLFLESGTAAFGLPASWDKSRKLANHYLRELVGGLHGDINVYEGSGISRKNRLTAHALLSILEHFQKYSSLLQQRNQFLVKSGTLNNVFCYAGYFLKNESLAPFIIMLNQQENNRDIILRLLSEQMLK